MDLHGVLILVELVENKLVGVVPVTEHVEPQAPRVDRLVARPQRVDLDRLQEWFI